MRKSFNTLFLVLLLIGPSILLTCVRQPATEGDQAIQAKDDIDATEDAVVLNAIPYP